jgi:hypothetical protein
MSTKRRLLKTTLAGSLFLVFLLVWSGLAWAGRPSELVIKAPDLVGSGKEFQVVVTDNVDNKPVENALAYATGKYLPVTYLKKDVTYEFDEETSIFLGKTDAQGTIQVVLEDPGEYFLIARKPMEDGPPSSVKIDGYCYVSVMEEATGLYLHLPSNVFARGENIVFTLFNNSEETISLPGSAPFSIFDESGDIYNPIQLMILIYLQPGDSYTWTWNQKDNDENQVAPGIYGIQLTTSAGLVYADFQISNMEISNIPDKAKPKLTPQRPFSDVTGEVSWGDPHILYLHEKGIVKGRSQTEFDPDGTLSRAEFLALLLRSAGLDANQSNLHENVFPDVSKEHWAYNNILTALDLGIITIEEYPDGFGPDEPVTRLEMALMTTRISGAHANTLNHSPDSTTFQDANQVDARYRSYISYVGARGIIIGYEDNTFRPHNNMTRREACVVIYRLLESGE